MTGRLRPVTERIFAQLPNGRLLWIGIWAVVPWLNAAANLLLETEARSAVWEQSALFVILNYAALSFGIVISLLGAGRIARGLENLQATTAKVLEGESRDLFRGVDSVVGPIVAAGAAATLFAVSALAQDGWLPAILRGATWFVVGVALFSFLWTYASLLLGLNRLGRAHLVLRAVRVDPGLGLQPLGAVATTGLWMLLAWLVPVLLTGLPDVVGAVLGILVLTAVLATFFLSLLRLHWQMVEVKASELAIARDLYAQAYEPVREAPTLETLEQQRSLLSAADALEKRAGAIYEWPFAERTPTLVLAITTSVLAMTIGRLVAKPLGL